MGEPEYSAAGDEPPLDADTLLTIFESLSDALAVLDSSGQVVAVNETATERYGSSRAALRGQLFTWTGADDTAAAAAERPLTEPAVFEWTATDSEGAIFPEEVTLRPLDDDRILAVARRIDNPHEQAATHAERQQELAYTSDWLSEFTSMVSHDLRNPLGVARMYLDFARDTGDDADFDAVAEALDQMDAMIDSMLTVARADRTVSDTDRLPLRELVTEAWASTTADDASLQADIPSEIFVDGDRRLLGDVFEHLFQNSIEHNDTPVTVTVTLLDGDSTGIAVEDDGDGIPADQREEVFDQGFTTAEDSVGFGLAIVERFLAAHGWDVTVTEGTAGGA